MKKKFLMKGNDSTVNSPLELRVMQEFIETCTISWQKGWNERNGGNMSYRMKEEEVAEVDRFFTYDKPFMKIGLKVENLAGEFFIVTGSGKCYKNVAKYPEDNICIAQIDETGENYRIVWGLVNGGKPTSEFSTHLLNHSVKKEATDGKFRLIMHAHPVNTVALTFILPLDSKVFSRELWEMMPECAFVFPEGLGVLPWMLCGGTDIAYATGELIRRFNTVIWAHHGVFTSGPDFDEAFGIMETVEKAAEMLVKVISCGGKRQTMKKEQILALSENYDVNIDKTLLE